MLKKKLESLASEKGLQKVVPAKDDAKVKDNEA